ncbi:MAG: hypothetical protein KA099_05285 [Alphaproteobacteria bacterium]|nr:hypothetical protein [Alphaproteobacteria bacterium]MBP7759876.1 hypothetical protein [Alphaproteobacteria bacterium]MBP7763196.1 hypothetical protein [Alphaproteobacteria bacterium]MBP7904726.1 hypothetical protein [Alphaproteobacteria bacterium]
MEYHGHMYDQKGEVFAMRVKEAINKASKPEGTDPRNYTNRPRVFSNVDIYDTPYVGIDRNEYGEAELLLKRLRNVDPEKLRGDIGAAIQEASDFVETNRKIAEKNASLERD